jgi:hypothetical protein
VKRDGNESTKVLGEPLPVFLSAPTPHLPTQHAFLTQVKETLQANAMIPRVVERRDGDSRSTLVPINEAMSACFGTVAIVLARSLVVEGLEYVGSTYQRDISTRYLTTPWIHIEVALAFQLGLPILLLKEDLVYSEGVFGRANVASSIVTFSLKRDGFPQISEQVLKALTSFREDVEDFAIRQQGPHTMR